MATKNCDLALGGKSATFGNASFSNHDTSQQQYSNLNLNVGHHSAAKIDNPIQAKSISFKNDEGKIDDYNNSKENNCLWSKNKQSQQNSLNLLNGSSGEESEKQWKKKGATSDSTKKNSSTLSLHIAAYENSVEAALDKEEETSATKKKAKLASAVSSTYMFSPFEIPRQRLDERSEPEVMQFKASQKLLNPNATGSSSSRSSGSKSGGSSPLKNEKALPEINILVIGQTGEGKSTMINAIANYIGNKTLDDVLKNNNFYNIIPTEFQVTVEQNGEDIERSIRVGESENEDFTRGSSATQHPKPYVFRYKNRLVHIIDTPGIGDVRGPEQDAINMDNIMQFLSSYKKLHGICILMKPNESRLTPSFEWCFKRLLQEFNRSVVENIVFCFTNTNGYGFKPAQTVPTLKALLKEIEEDTKKMDPKKRGITIPIGPDRRFSYDNMAYRYACEVKHGIGHTSIEHEANKNAYSNSRESFKKMFDYILTLTPHNVADSLAVYRARNVIQKLCIPLARINTGVNETLQKVERKQALIQKYKYNEKELIKVLEKEIPFTRWTIQHDGQYFCGNQTCVKVEYYHDDERLQFFEAYPAVMDSNPFLLNVRQNMLKEKDDKCPDCGPNTKVEYKTEWLIQKEGVEIKEDKNVASEIKESLKTREGIVKEIQKVYQLRDELIAEKDAIIKASARFAHFMKENSTIPINDATEKYFKQLIEKEKRMGDEEKQKAYEDLLIQFDAEKMLLKNASEVGDNTITPANVMEVLEALKNLKHYGKDIAAAISECDKAIIVEASAEEVVVEPPKQSWTSTIYKWLTKPFTGK